MANVDNITGKTYLERGQPVRVLVRWKGKGPRNVLIQRDDGSRVVRPFRGLRKAFIEKIDEPSG
jgi:acetyl esterase